MKLGTSLNDCVDKNTYRNKIQNLEVLSGEKKTRIGGGQWKGRRANGDLLAGEEEEMIFAWSTACLLYTSRCV